ncbi:MerR family transcriptional regulator [Natronincola ferrireducens]|uniref:MerR family transcriptional regulator n=1 Tax=Natronincola ferrireducens TaxID=393762 RepID=UPI000B88DAD2|nr:MerR family transcriptional regulator [Natronincola ferrireducens]
MINEIYSIKEIADITGYKPHVIRFYEKEFELDIPRNESNRRYFTYNELEQLRYIKTLQEKGLTNKQIKQVLKSPEVIINSSEDPVEETAVTQMTLEDIHHSVEKNNLLGQEEFHYLLKEIVTGLHKFNYKEDIEELSMKIDDLKAQLINQEKDVLICENAKLKMKIKEKSYEVAELKEKLKREEHKKVSIFAKLFGTK